MSSVEAGSLIRQYRTSRQVTLAELASAIGYTESHLSRVERGELKRALPHDRIERIATRLNLTDDEQRLLYRAAGVPVPDQGQAQGLPGYLAGVNSVLSRYEEGARAQYGTMLADFLRGIEELFRRSEMALLPSLDSVARPEHEVATLDLDDLNVLISDLETHRSDQPGQHAALDLRLQAAFAQNNEVEAAALVEVALTNETVPPATIHNMAIECAKRSRNTVALKLFVRALGQAPQELAILRSLVVFLSRIDRDREALPYARQLVASDPSREDLSEVYLQVATYADAGNEVIHFCEPSESSEGALARFPASSTIAVRYLTAKMRTPGGRTAIADLIKTYAGRFEDDVAFLWAVAELLVEAERERDAIFYYERARTLLHGVAPADLPQGAIETPDGEIDLRPGILGNYALALSEVDRMPEADAVWERAADVERALGNSSRVRIQWARNLYRRGHEERAKALMEETAHVDGEGNT